MNHINYTQRNLEYINSAFKQQTDIINDCYYVKRKHILSADYPLLEFSNFKKEVSDILFNGRNPDNLKILLVPIQNLAIENIKIYNDVISPIWDCLFGKAKSNKFNGYEILKTNNGSSCISINTSKTIRSSTDPNFVFDNLPKKEYHNEDFYKYSLELNEFLEIVLKENSDLTAENSDLRFKLYWTKRKWWYHIHLIFFIFYIAIAIWCLLNRDNKNITNKFTTNGILIFLGLLTIIFNIVFSNYATFKDSWKMFNTKAWKIVKEKAKIEYIKFH